MAEEETVAEEVAPDTTQEPNQDTKPEREGVENLKVLENIDVGLSVEVGSTEIKIRDLLRLSEGSVIELDRLAGDPLDILVNGTMIAKGEVVTVVGDQPGRKGIPIEKRKKGQMKLFFPGFGTGYFYSLDVTEAGGRFGSRSKQKTAVLKAAEGFWIPSKKCEKYVYYAW